MIPGPWAPEALCAQADPGAWFPERGSATVTARWICGHCPVRSERLDYALSAADTRNGVSTGIWGGTTPPERALLRRQRKADDA